MILRELLDRDPKNNTATFWLAYLHVYYNWLLGADSLDKATELLNQIIISGDSWWGAAARMVLYGALRARDRSDAFRAVRITCLEESVNAQPEWILNHRYLGFEHLEAQRYAEAFDQIKTAQRNTALPKPQIVDLIDFRFESLVTGRLARNIEKRLATFEEKILQKQSGAEPIE